MALSNAARRAYLEGWHRHTRGQRTPKWRGNEDDVVIWVEAFDLSRQQSISPWDALLLAVQRRAARVQWVDQVISEIMKQDRKDAESDPDREITGIPPEAVRPWLAESRNEERLMTRAAKMAIDAGVAEAMIRQMEREGRIVTDALIAGLDVLNLSPEERLRALTSMHRALTAGVDGAPMIENTTLDNPENSGDDQGAA